VADIIGANILNIARQDYDPQGASVTILISEEPVIDKKAAGKEVLISARPRPAALGCVVAHLDKSHITVHTYPETHPDNGIATFRADIDVATCGVISPLKALNYLIESFESDIVIMDYRVRGFTRDVKGKKHYIDHKINSIQDYLAKNIKRPLRDVRRQRLPGKHLPHQDAPEGLRPRQLPVRGEGQEPRSRSG
jgi:S-adenosylmethionine decarboxylase